MFLYHGSNIEIKKIDLSLSKPYKDFGRGFYLSDNYEQALQMANFKTSLLGGNPVVNVSIKIMCEKIVTRIGFCSHQNLA